MKSIYNPYAEFMHSAKERNLFRDFVSVQRCNLDNIKSSRFITVDNQNFINLSSNDYLALSCDPRLSQRAGQWAKQYGTGAGSSRLVTGNLSLFSIIEKKIAHLKNKEAALVMGSGFQTNATILQALFDQKILRQSPLIFTDRLNHSSIHFGCAAAKISQIRYKHCDSKHLQALLEKHNTSSKPKFIITETIFSMDGDTAPIEDIAQLARQHNAILIVDDAHSIGGDATQNTILSKADLIIGTFSKAFGSYGSYVAGSQTLIDYFKNRCTGLIYSTALPPPVLGAIDAALDLYPDLTERRSHLLYLTHKLQDGLKSYGLDIGNSASHIIPIIVKQSQKALALSQVLQDNQFWITAIRPPTVPKNMARLRLSLTSALTEEDIEKFLTIIRKNI